MAKPKKIKGNGGNPSVFDAAKKSKKNKKKKAKMLKRIAGE